MVLDDAVVSRDGDGITLDFRSCFEGVTRLFHPCPESGQPMRQIVIRKRADKPRGG